MTNNQFHQLPSVFAHVTVIADFSYPKILSSACTFIFKNIWVDTSTNIRGRRAGGGPNTARVLIASRRRVIIIYINFPVNFRRVFTLSH